MVNGIEIFRAHFSNFQDQYMVIGGFACDLLMSDAGLEFRRTEDIDMVLIVEALTTEFAEAFWSFIEAGGYRARQRSSGKPEFYRFVDPTDASYPKMIELFSRPQSGVVLRQDSHLMPLHIDDEVSSLSAILLNDDYYHFLLNGKMVSAGVSILDAEHIIPLKMKAWLDLTEKRAEGHAVNSRDIKKHRQDVFRLFPLLKADVQVSIPATILADIGSFIGKMRETEVSMEGIGVTRSKDEILEIFSAMYIAE